MGASLARWAPAGGNGGTGVRCDKTVLAGACSTLCGACTTLTGGGFGGGSGGTGSRAANTGGLISSHSNTSLCRRFAIMRRGVIRSGAGFKLRGGTTCGAPQRYASLFMKPWRPAGTTIWSQLLGQRDGTGAAWLARLADGLASLQRWIVGKCRATAQTPSLQRGRTGRSIQASVSYITHCA